MCSPTRQCFQHLLNPGHRSRERRAVCAMNLKCPKQTIVGCSSSLSVVSSRHCRSPSKRSSLQRKHAKNTRSISVKPLGWAWFESTRSPMRPSATGVWTRTAVVRLKWQGLRPKQTRIQDAATEQKIRSSLVPLRIHARTGSSGLVAPFCPLAFLLSLYQSGRRLVGAVGIEIEIQFRKSWIVKGVAPLPFFQLVSNGVRCLRICKIRR